MWKLGKLYMQDMTLARLAELMPDTGDYATIYDKRDEEPYIVGRLADGNYWMLDNLRFSDETYIMSSSDTNIALNMTWQFPNASGVWAYSYTNAYIYSELKNDTSATHYGNGSGKKGVFYNMCAATAGTFCYDENSGSGSANYDICPAGWRIPTGGSSGDYQMLYSKYNSNVNNFNNAFSLVLGGTWNGSNSYVDQYGYYWSKTPATAANNYTLRAGSSEIDTARSLSRNVSRSIRCIKTNPKITITSAGSGVSSVKVCKTSGNCSGDDLLGTVTTSGGNVSGLKYGSTYYLYPTFLDGGEFVSWAKTSSTGTLSSISASNPTFTMGDGDGAVTLVSVIDYCIKNSIANANCMQKMTPSDCTTTAKIVTDSRDGSTYLVQRLSDNKCWMLDNLRLGSTSKITLYPSNTNLPDSVTSWDLPASSSSGFSSYTTAMINTTSKDNTTTGYGSGSKKIGVYYNYCAASAGNICTDSNSSNGSADRDVCPKGWRMPTGDSSGEYQTLYTKYSSNASNFRNALSTPLSGYFYNSSASYQGSDGEFWSSTRDDTTYMYVLYVNSSNVVPAGGSLRRLGYSVRCLLK